MVVGPCPVCGGSRVEKDYLFVEGHWVIRNARICSVCRVGIHTPAAEKDGRPRIGLVKAISRPPRPLGPKELFTNRY